MFRAAKKAPEIVSSDISVVESIPTGEEVAANAIPLSPPASAPTEAEQRRATTVGETVRRGQRRVQCKIER